MDNSLLDPGNPANPLILPRYCSLQTMGMKFTEIVNKKKLNFMIDIKKGGAVHVDAMQHYMVRNK
ncbi:hypothetical protein T08_2649 [Trichinella sp. T8]|nr:hypothetical protein T08_2649 [Trichinella sp. T8]